MDWQIVLDTANSVLAERRYLEPKDLKVKMGLLELENEGGQVSSGSVSIKGLRLGDQSSMSNAGRSQRK